ncbi:retrotransposon protein, putative, ty1-copia subclass [Tanacetum coccineum]
MLQELKFMFKKQAGVERFDLIQTFHTCKQEEGKPVGPYVIKMKNYVEQLERIGYVLPQDLSVGLILNGLTIDFTGFAATLQVMAIQGKSLNAKGKGKGKDKSYISRPKNPKPSVKEHPTKDDICHHCKEVGHWKRNCPAYLAELIKKKKKVGIAKTATHILNLIPTKKVDKTPYELWYGKVPNLSYLKDTQRKRWGYYFYFLSENRIIVARSARTHQAPDRLCLNVEVEKHSLNNQVWRLVDLPSNGKTVGTKWLFKKKTNMDGNVHTYKACLVAKGFTQTYRVDYEETFSPVNDIRAIRILIAIEAFYEIWKMNVKTAFLNGFLDKDIYMANGSNVTFLVLYVDDIVIIGNHIPSLQSVKSYLGKCFAMKDLGETSFILGIKICRDRSKRLIGLSQSAYMDKILKRFRIDTSKCGYILMQERLDLNKTQGEVKRMQNVPYASILGEPHWTAVKTILKYLRNTKDMFLVYSGNPKAEL